MGIVIYSYRFNIMQSVQKKHMQAYLIL